MDEYLNSLSLLELKHFIKLYENHRPLNSLKTKEDLKEELKELMTNGTYRCLAKCKKNCDCFYQKKDLEGAGFIDLFRAPKKEYSNSSKKTLKTYGSSIIKSISVVRTPILGIIDKVINALTFGKLKSFKSKYNYDSLFHLALLFKIEHNNTIKSIIIEKNEIINISSGFSSKTTTEYFEVPLNNPNLTLNTVLDNTLKKIGPQKYFLYDGIKNNCQDFIQAILNSNNLLNQSINNFVKQDISELADKLPKNVKKIMNITTDTAARLQHFVGAGALQSEEEKKAMRAKFLESKNKIDNNQINNKIDNFNQQNEIIGKQLNNKANFDNREFIAASKEKKRKMKIKMERLWTAVRNRGWDESLGIGIPEWSEQYYKKYGEYLLPDGEYNWRWVKKLKTRISFDDLGFLGNIIKYVGLKPLADGFITLGNSAMDLAEKPSLNNLSNVVSNTVGFAKSGLDTIKAGPTGLAKNAVVGALGGSKKYTINPKLK